MKKIILLLFINYISSNLFAQGGWRFETSPANDISSYTSTNAYVGCSFIDLNGDNFPDIYAAPNSIFLNNGNGTFSKADTLPFTALTVVAGSSCADLDNDGDNDIIISGVPSKVYFNDGFGYFYDSTAQVPDLNPYGSWAVAIGDYNKDRELDFFFAHAAGFLAPAAEEPCRFYRQQSTIFDPLAVSLSPVTEDLNSYTNPYWSDFDLDGDMDLFIASGPAGTPGYDYCYKNLKIETGVDSLVKMSTELFTTQTQDGQCYNFIDYDNDGDLDLCLTNYIGAITRFYKNNGGSYTVLTTPFSGTTTNISNCWGDYDNDGDLDVIITNDRQKSKYYRNNGDGTFTFLLTGFSTPTATNGITNADFDNDGDLDIFTNGIGSTGNTSSVGLFINDSVALNNNFVNIKLVGVASNVSCIGAIVKLKSVISGVPVWQLREVNAQNTFQGQNDLRLHFGLGNATVIDSIIVKYPSGAIEYYMNYPVNSFYQITEGVGILNVAVKEKSITGSDITLLPNPATDKLTIRLSRVQSPIYYSLLDLQGRTLQTGEVNGINHSIDIHSLTKGAYLIILYNNKINISKKFIKY